MPAGAPGTAYVTTGRGNIPWASQASAGKLLLWCQTNECFAYFSQKEKGFEAEVNITIFSYCTDLCVLKLQQWNVISEVFNWQTLGTTEGDDRASFEEIRVSAVIPSAAPWRRSNKSHGGE